MKRSDESYCTWLHPMSSSKFLVRAPIFTWPQLFQLIRVTDYWRATGLVWFGGNININYVFSFGFSFLFILSSIDNKGVVYCCYRFKFPRLKWEFIDHTRLSIYLSPSPICVYKQRLLILLNGRPILSVSLPLLIDDNCLQLLALWHPSIKPQIMSSLYSLSVYSLVVSTSSTDDDNNNNNFSFSDEPHEWLLLLLRKRSLYPSSSSSSINFLPSFSSILSDNQLNLVQFDLLLFFPNLLHLHLEQQPVAMFTCISVYFDWRPSIVIMRCLSFLLSVSVAVAVSFLHSSLSLLDGCKVHDTNCKPVKDTLQFDRISLWTVCK